MRAWYSRLAIGLLSISLVHAGVAACCWTPEQLNSGVDRDCHHIPRSSHTACAPADAVEGVMKESFTNCERLRVTSPVAAAIERTTAPAGSVGDLLNVGEAVPWFPDDLLLRVHVFRI
jgi:hypothetical protein